MKAFWCWIWHFGCWEFEPRYGAFGVWDVKCNHCGREWTDFEP